MRIGLDIGGTKTDAVILDGPSTVASRLRRPTGSGNAAVLDGAEHIVRDLLARAGATLADTEQIGIGIPGVVDATGRVQHAVNLGLTDLWLSRELHERLGVPVRVENDVKAAALGASHLLGLRGPTAFLNLGTGLAAGIVVDGEVWRGARGGAGEIGHLAIVRDGVLCACGQRGCLETVASGSAVARMWPTDAPLPAVDLFDRADAGEPAAVAVRGVLAAGVASAVRVLLLTVDVETVVIGGGLSDLGERLLRPVRAQLAEWGTHSPFLASLEMPERVRLLPAGASAAAVGAALLGGEPVPV